MSRGIMKKYLRFSFVGFWIFLGFLFVFGKLFYLTVFEKTDKKESNPEKIQYMRGFIYSADNLKNPKRKNTCFYSKGWELTGINEKSS
jgi:cell division protein FtsI/penicillin-binding protein 2